jgi:hypothetical protein
MTGAAAAALASASSGSSALGVNQLPAGGRGATVGGAGRTARAGGSRERWSFGESIIIISKR